MALYRHEISFERLDDTALDAWREIPAAVAADCMNREQTMQAAIKPLAPGMRLCAQARTANCMVGDNGPIHAGLRLFGAGDVMVVSARGHEDTALVGALVTRAAMKIGLAGLVIDGAVRDAAEIRSLGFACFARAVVPAGPHKGWGGTLDGVISCGGVSVAPGDLVIGDDDGVTVVPLARQAAVLEAAQARLSYEAEALEQLKSGKPLGDTFGVPEPEVLD